MSHFNGILHATKYAINTKYYFYDTKQDVNLNEPRELYGYSDADFVGDNDTQKTMTV